MAFSCGFQKKKLTSHSVKELVFLTDRECVARLGLKIFSSGKAKLRLNAVQCYTFWRLAAYVYQNPRRPTDISFRELRSGPACDWAKLMASFISHRRTHFISSHLHIHHRSSFRPQGSLKNPFSLPGGQLCSPWRWRRGVMLARSVR